MISQTLLIVSQKELESFWIYLRLDCAEKGPDFSFLRYYVVLNLDVKHLIVCFFLNKQNITTFIVTTIVLYSFGDLLFEHSQTFLSDFFLSEVVSDDFLDEFGDIFVAFRKVFIEFVNNHSSELFSLLYGLSLFDG